MRASWLNSLKGRLSLVTAAVLVIFVLFISGALEHAYRISLAEAKQRELQLHVYTLLAVAEPDGERLYFPPVLPEQRFNQPDSGLIGMVIDGSGKLIWRSASAISPRQIQLRPLPQGDQAFTQIVMPDAADGDAEGRRYSSFRQGVAWGLDNQQQFTFAVLEDAAPLRAQVAQFRSTLWRWLGFGAVLLVLVQWLVLRWGLAPLNTVARALQKMQRGGSDTLQGNFPRELQPLTDNLNLLIENERRQREKTRNTLADLAHSMKTPLAVLKGLNFSADPRTAYNNLIEQVQRMDAIVSYQLQRAVATTPKSILRGVEVAPLAQKIVAALEKVYRETPAEVSLHCPEDTLFYGDEGDLMELLGNLLDNAYKYGAGRIEAAIKNHDSDRGLHISVADNGPGISEDQWRKVTQRGVRADERQPGQGIGLAIVIDIVHSYGGDIAVAPSAMGGAEISIDLK
ncbi:ATP-binding protein [Microbulbifer sp. TYP-18]|uniref:ATP-binding protein n=1 Tax=Microbulbifer sp. TYP-18 TaxID=3230024 RepID=UPI0034C6B6D5